MAQPTVRGSEPEWYREAFDDLYPVLYAHRDQREAELLLEVIAREVGCDGGRILDLGCGPGRFLTGLESRGARAVGVDLSMPLLLRARAVSPRSPLVRADMRELPLRSGIFRTVLMMFTTFGYFADRVDDVAVLAGIARVLEPEGTLVLDTINPRYAREHLVTRSGRLVGEYQVVERRWIDPDGPFLRKRTEVGPLRDGSIRVYRERLRLYEPAELDALLDGQGFTVSVRWGDYRGRAFDVATSPRLLLVARPAGDRS